MSKADSKHPVTALEIPRDQLGGMLVSSFRPEKLVPQIYYMHIIYCTYVLIYNLKYTAFPTIHTYVYTYTSTYSVSRA